MGSGARLGALAATLGLVTVGGCQVEGDRPGAPPADSVAAVRPPDPAPGPVPEAEVRPDVSPVQPDTTVSSARSARLAARAALLDLVERSGDGDAQALSRALAQVNDRLGDLPDRPAALDSLRRAARAAERRGDRPALALAAAEAHHALAEDGTEAERLQSLALLLDARTRSALPDWAAVREDARALRAAWERQAPRVDDDGLHDALAAAVRGAEAGAETQNAPLVRLGAEVVADLAVSRPADAR